MVTKILFVGFGNEIPIKEHDEFIENINFDYNQEDSKYTLNKNLPTFYDYHIVFINNPNFFFNQNAPDSADHSIISSLVSKKEEIVTLVEGGHVLVTFLAKIYSKEYYYSAYSKTKFDNYEWLPFKIELTSKPGSEYKVEETIFNKVLSKDFFEWQAHYNHKFTPANITPLAKNIPGFPIAFMQDVNPGKIIYFPKYNHSFQKELLRSIIDIIKNKLFKKENLSSSIAPDWIFDSKYYLLNEKDLIEQKNKIDSELEMANTSKKILYETGKELSKSVAFVLDNLNFEKIKYLELDESDINILDNNILYTIEVKGKKDYANLNDLRQLLDWYMREKSKDESKNIKGIFVVNHYKDRDIDLRAEAFTESAIKFATNNDFLLMTTPQLFSILKKFKTKEINKGDIIKLFSQNGILKI